MLRMLLIYLNIIKSRTPSIASLVEQSWRAATVQLYNWRKSRTSNGQPGEGLAWVKPSKARLKPLQAFTKGTIWPGLIPRGSGVYKLCTCTIAAAIPSWP